MFTSLALICSGCGGSSEPDPALIAHANAICKKYYDQEYSMKPPIGMAELKMYAQELTAIRHDRVKDLQDLNPPEADRKRYMEFVAGLNEENQLIDDLVAAGNGPRREEIRKRGGELYDSVRRQARELGLTWCEKDAGTAERSD